MTDLEKLIDAFEILEYIKEAPACTAPSIKKYMGIPHTKPPNQAEKDFYSLISKLERDGYINKKKMMDIKRRGAQFKMRITEEGNEILFKYLEQRERGRKREHMKVEEKMSRLNSVLRIFGSDVVDIIEDLIVYASEGRFNMMKYTQQKEIIDRINVGAEKIKNKMHEIIGSYIKI